MSRTLFPWYCWIIGCCSLLAGCNDEAALRRWGREWEKLPPPSYPAVANGVIPSAEAVRLEMARYEALAEKFNRIEVADLETSSRLRWENYAGELKEALENQSRLIHDPSVFNMGESLTQVLQQEEGDLNQQLQTVEKCLDNAPAYYETAKQLLERPDPAGTLEAIQKHLETLRLLRDSLPGFLEKTDADQQQYLQQKTYRARLALKDYLAFCQSLYFEHGDTTIVRNLRDR